MGIPFPLLSDKLNLNLIAMLMEDRFLVLIDDASIKLSVKCYPNILKCFPT